MPIADIEFILLAITWTNRNHPKANYGFANTSTLCQPCQLQASTSPQPNNSPQVASHTHARSPVPKTMTSTVSNTSLLVVFLAWFDLILPNCRRVFRCCDMISILCSPHLNSQTRLDVESSLQNAGREVSTYLWSYL